MTAFEPFLTPNCSIHRFIPYQIFPNVDQGCCPAHHFITPLIVSPAIKTIPGLIQKTDVLTHLYKYGIF
jgi:hypothetical protein